MITRAAKLLLLAGVALFYSLVVFNNLTDFNSNYQLVRHVLMMDTTFPGNHGMWRALTSPAAAHSFYIAIIVWEIVTAILLWWGCLTLSRTIRRSAMDFESAKRIPVIALTLSLLMWLVALGCGLGQGRGELPVENPIAPHEILSFADQAGKLALTLREACSHLRKGCSRLRVLRPLRDLEAFGGERRRTLR